LYGVWPTDAGGEEQRELLRYYGEIGVKGVRREMAWIDDSLWVLGVLITALVCVLYSRRAAREQDIVLAWTAGIAAAVFWLAAVLYLWWVWLAP
jgi:hypothetical protein